MADADRPQTFTTREAAAILGVSRDRMRRYQADGDIHYTQSSLNRTRLVTRDDLVAFCVRTGLPLGRLRRKLNPTRKVLACGCDGFGLGISVAGFPVVHAATMFDAGRLLSAEAFWAVVVHLEAIGREGAIRDLDVLSREADRPFLIGLIGDEPATGRRSAAVFDVVYPATASVAAFADMIRRLRWSDL